MKVSFEVPGGITVLRGEVYLGHLAASSRRPFGHGCTARTGRFGLDGRFKRSNTKEDVGL